MERCPRCRAELAAYAHAEVDLWGRLAHVVVLECAVCGYTDRIVTELELAT